MPAIGCERWKFPLLVAAVCMLMSACVSQQPRKTVPAAPTPAPPAAVATSPSPPSPPEIHTAKSHRFEQDKTLLKGKLANSQRDSLLPGEVGYYLDVLQGRIKQTMGPGIVLGRGYDRIVLDLSRLISFGPGQSSMDRASRQSLALLIPVLREYRKTLVSLRIRAEDGSRSARQLAHSRARAVARFLVESGLQQQRILISDLTPSQAEPTSPPNVHVEMQLEPIVRSDKD